MANKYGRKRYNILCVILLFSIMLMFCGTVRANNGKSVWPEITTPGEPGSEVSIPINVADIGGLEAWDIVVQYDPNVLTFLDVDILGTLSEQYYEVVNGLGFDSDLGGVQVGGMLYFDTNGIVLPPPPGTGGVLFNANFQVTDQVPAATEVALEVLSDGPPAQLQTTGSDVFYAQDTPNYMVTLADRFIKTTEGKYVWVPIIINSTHNLSEWNMILTYDSDSLRYIDYIMTDLLGVGYDPPDGALFINESSPGTIEMAGMTMMDMNGDGGAFLKLKFMAKHKVGTSEIQLDFPEGIDNQLGSVPEDDGIVQVMKYIPPTPMLQTYLEMLPTYTPIGWTLAQTIPPFPISGLYSGYYDRYYSRYYGLLYGGFYAGWYGSRYYWNGGWW